MITPYRLCALMVLLNVTQLSARKRPRLTVFVHGTVGWYLAVLSPSWFKHGEVQDDMYYPRAVRERRKDSDHFEHHLMLDEGLIEISPSLIEDTRAGTLSREQARCGSYFIISAYDAAAQAVGDSVDGDRYATFGWSGLNTQSARMQAGYELYESLCLWRDQYKEMHGFTPHIDIMAYSHGGGVSFFLAKAERERRKDLKIRVLGLFGTPFQVETHHFLLDEMFNSILSFGAAGDTIQTMDAFSTVVGESFSRLRHMINVDLLKERKPHLYRADVDVSLNQDGAKITHFNYFSLDNESLHISLDPLPIVTLAPIFINQALRHTEHSSLRARITCAQGLLKLILKSARDYEESALEESENFYDVIRQQRHHVRDHWWPIKKQKQSFWSASPAHSPL